MKNNKTIDEIANTILTNDFPLDKGEYVTLFYDDSTKQMGQSLEISARKISPRKVYAFNIDDLDRCHDAHSKENNHPAQFLPVVKYFLEKSDRTIFIASLQDGEQQSFLGPMNDIISQKGILSLYRPNLSPENYLQ